MQTTSAVMTRPSRKLVTVLAAVAVIIVGVHLGTLIANYFLGHDNLFGMTMMFDVDRERNVPAVFSFLLLLIAAVLLAVIARKQPSGSKPSAALWAGLSAVFFYLMADEGFSVHEYIGSLVADALGGGKLTHYAWLIPYAIGGLVLGVIYLRFLRQLPRDTRKQFLIAGTIFVGGAFGTEILAGIYVYFQSTENTFAYDLLSALEETLEMTGVIWFICALMSHLEKHSAPTPERRGAVAHHRNSRESTSA